jgi:hypothetical protein
VQQLPRLVGLFCCEYFCTPLASREVESEFRCQPPLAETCSVATMWSDTMAQMQTAKDKDALEAELAKLRAQVARARFLEDDSQKNFKEKVAQYQQEAQGLKIQLASQRSEHQKDAESLVGLERLLAARDQELREKDKALESMSSEILRLNLQLDDLASRQRQPQGKVGALEGQGVSHEGQGVSTLFERNPCQKIDQAVQTLTFLLQFQGHQSTQTDNSDEGNRNRDDASLSQDVYDSSDGDSDAGGGRNCGGIMVRQAAISARTTWMITYAASAWCSATFTTRMREQRACFDRLIYYSALVYKERELEEEHSKRMHLEKELEDVRHLQAIKQGLDAAHKAVCEQQQILEHAQDSNDEGAEEEAKASGALDDTVFQGRTKGAFGGRSNSQCAHL